MLHGEMASGEARKGPVRQTPWLRNFCWPATPTLRISGVIPELVTNRPLIIYAPPPKSRIAAPGNSPTRVIGEMWSEWRSTEYIDSSFWRDRVTPRDLTFEIPDCFRRMSNAAVPFDVRCGTTMGVLV